MSRERELLEQALDAIEHGIDFNRGRTLKTEIREYLESKGPEKRKPLRDEEILNIYVSGIVFEKTFFAAFKAGVRWAEKYHGIEEEE